jgi:hypothetical protein
MKETIKKVFEIAIGIGTFLIVLGVSFVSAVLLIRFGVFLVTFNF